MSYFNTFMYAEGSRYLEKAMSLRHRVSEKEQLLLEGDYYRHNEKTIPQAIDAYRRFIEIYPDDSFVRVQLSNIYIQYELYEKSVEHGLAAIRNKHKTYFPYSYTATAYEALGQPEKAKGVIDSYFRDFGDSGPLHADLSDYYLYSGKYPEALAEIDRALALSPGASQIAFLRGPLFVYQGDLARAAGEYHRLREFEDPSAPMYSLYGLTRLALLQGKFGEAKSLAERGIAALEPVKEEFFCNIFRQVAAYALSRSNRYPEAMTLYKRIHNAGLAIDSLLWQRIALFMQGLVLCQEGSLGEAGRVAADLDARCRTSLNPQDQNYVNLGRIHERLGHRAEAVENYRKFIDLWKEADAGLTEVPDARARLAALQ